MFVFSMPADAAPSNQTISFSARLKNSTGGIVPDGHYNIEFKLYTQNTGGAPVWTETYSDTNGPSAGQDNRIRVIDGYMNIKLGSLEAFENIDWNGDLWMSMNIGGTEQTANISSIAWDGEMSPRIQLSAVPYSMNSNAVGGKSADQLVQLGQGTQEDSGNQSSIAINKTGTGNFLQLQAGGVDVFTVDNTGSIILGSASDQSISIAKSTSGIGHNLTLAAGQGADGADNNGGKLTIQGGAANGTNASGGGVHIDAGINTGTAQGGTIEIGTENASSIVIGNPNSTTTIDGSLVVNGTLFSANEFGNLMPDPSFERDGQHLSKDGSFSIVNDSAGARSGNKYFSATANGTHQDTLTREWVNVTPGDTYYAETWIKADAETDGEIQPIMLQFADKDYSNIAYASLSSNNPGTNWTKASAELIVPEGMHYMKFGFSVRNSSTTGTWHIDDYYISKASVRHGIYSSGTIQGNFVDAATKIKTAGVTRIDQDGILFNVAAGADIIQWGTINSGLINGSYSGITKVGTLSELNVSGNINTSGSLQTGGVTRIDNSGNLTNIQNAALAGNLTIASGGTISLAGGDTASRPSEPTEGMLYFDTTTDKLLVYADGKWQGDQSDAVYVAANNSSRADKDAADYVADGDQGGSSNGDQIQINAALSSGAGKKVVLLPGIYTIDGSINVPNNTTLIGVGRGTVIRLADTDTSVNMIQNSDTSTGTGIVIQDMDLDGRNDLNTAGTQEGIYLNGMGGGSGAGARQGARINNVNVSNFRNAGIYLNNSRSNTITNSRAQGNSNGFRISNNSYWNVINSNIAQGNSTDGFLVDTGSTNNTFFGNLAQGNTGVGFHINANTITLTGNTVIGSASYGIYLNSVFYATVNGNTVQDQTSHGIFVSNSYSNTISGNTLRGNGGSGTYDSIRLTSSDSNLITQNNISDNGGAGYAINISNASSNRNSIDSNTFSGEGASTINDASTDTIYSGQVNESGDYIIQSTGSTKLMNDTDISGNVTVKSTLNNTSAFQVQNSANATVLSVSTDSGNTLTLGNSTGTAGTIGLSSGNGFTGSLNTSGLTANRTYTLPDEDGTLCLQNSASCGFVKSDGQSAQNGSLWLTGGGKFGGSVGIQTTSNSNSALNVQNSNGIQLFNVDTLNNRVSIGTSDTTGTLLVLDSKTDSGDPTGTDGAMYYNASAGKFRCFESSTWKDCITPLPVSKVAEQDTDNLTTTPIDVNGLDFTLAKNTKYYYKFVIIHEAAAETTGIGFGVTTPSNPVMSNWCINTTSTLTSATAGHWGSYCGVGDAAATTTGAENMGTKYTSTMEGYIETDEDAGNLKLRMKSESAAETTVKTGSFGILQIVQ